MIHEFSGETGARLPADMLMMTCTTAGFAPYLVTSRYSRRIENCL